MSNYYITTALHNLLLVLQLLFQHCHSGPELGNGLLSLVNTVIQRGVLPPQSLQLFVQPGALLREGGREGGKEGGREGGKEGGRKEGEAQGSEEKSAPALHVCTCTRMYAVQTEARIPVHVHVLYMHMCTFVTGESTVCCFWIYMYFCDV